jgi:hypothetical protein
MGRFPRVHRLSSLPEISGGGYADVLRYFKCTPIKKIRWNRQTRRAKKTKEKMASQPTRKGDRFRRPRSEITRCNGVDYCWCFVFLAVDLGFESRS